MNVRRSILGATCLVSLVVLSNCGSDDAVVTPTDYSDAGHGFGSDASKHDGGSTGDDDSGSGDDDSGSVGDDSGSGDDDSGPGTDSGTAKDSGNTGGPLTGDGCAGGTCQNPTCKALGTAAAPGTQPETGFDAQPSFIPNNMIIPTFDDVPDGADSTDPSNAPGAWTSADLKFFNQNKMHVDMFINTDNWCSTIDGSSKDDPDCHAAIIEILTNHNPANHTIYHPHLGTPATTTNPPDGCNTASGCESEITGVETVVNKMSNGGRPHLTRFRAPYGEPYQTADQGKLAIVGPVVAKYAVEVDWNLDSGDSTCGSPCALTGTDIYNNVVNLVGSAPGQGRWGILLMHGTYKWTHDSLPKLFGPTGYFATHGFKVATVEDAICWKYGKHSWQIVQQVSGKKRDPN